MSKELSEHSVVIIPGIPAWNFAIKVLSFPWRFAGLRVHIYVIDWSGTESAFEAQFNKLLDLIDMSAERGAISLIGISAGGAVALHAFNGRKGTVHKLITICSRHKNPRGHSVRNATRYPIYRKVLALAGNEEVTLTPQDRKKIMTVRGVFDERVATEVVPIRQATNIRVPVILHALVIASAFTIFARPLVTFLKAE